MLISKTMKACPPRRYNFRKRRFSTGEDICRLKQCSRWIFSFLQHCLKNYHLLSLIWNNQDPPKYNRNHCNFWCVLILFTFIFVYCVTPPLCSMYMQWVQRSEEGAIYNWSNKWLWASQGRSWEPKMAPLQQQLLSHLSFLSP